MFMPTPDAAVPTVVVLPPTAGKPAPLSSEPAPRPGIITPAAGIPTPLVGEAAPRPGETMPTVGEGAPRAGKSTPLRSPQARFGSAGVSSDDPDAVVKLRARIQQLEDHHALMVATNKAHVRFLKNPASLETAELPEDMKTLIRLYKRGFSFLLGEAQK
ncbi:MAG TPA: hypothetical protein VIH93_14500 [Thermoanaerobaculia bacterium]|jgi:hypothetical protein